MSELKPISLSELLIRPMVSQDLAAVLAIERNAHISPWSRLSFEESLTRSEKPLAGYEKPLADYKKPLAYNKKPLADYKKPLAGNKKPLAVDRESSINNRVSLGDETAPYYCRVLQRSNAVIAYYVVSRIADELHVLNVVVSTTVQGSGLGHVLMQDIEQLARKLRLSKLFLEVRASNEIAQGLYLKWQYKQIAVRKKYYSARLIKDAVGTKRADASLNNDREDALVFMRLL